MFDELGSKLEINAWTGAGSATADNPDFNWTFRQRVEGGPTPRLLAIPKEADPTDWTDPRVGFGVVLEETPGLSAAVLASGDDAPSPIRKLIAERQKKAPVPVFRYIPSSSLRFSLLRNYAAGKDVDISMPPRGVAPGALPSYLLIVGSPDCIPWSLQYTLNANTCVGRLDLDESALDRYVTALLDQWAGSAASVVSPLVWSVNFGGGDISELMRNCIAKPVADKLGGDPSIGDKRKFLDAAAADRGSLAAKLADQKPALIVTTSHGMTGPLNDPTAMAANLGLLVDQQHEITQPNDLLANWKPDGAVWYAHACCSAGSDNDCNFEGLVPAGSSVDQVLKGVAAIGSRVSPLPKALLGATNPLRCFIGHVEPTFDWTLRHPQTGQFLTDSLVNVLYNQLGAGKPVGLAFQQYYRSLGALFGQHDQASRAFNRGDKGVESTMLRALLAARDIRSTVLLGDPLVTLPAIP